MDIRFTPKEFKKSSLLMEDENGNELRGGPLTLTIVIDKGTIKINKNRIFIKYPDNTEEDLKLTEEEYKILGECFKAAYSSEELVIFEDKRINDTHKDIASLLGGSFIRNASLGKLK